MEFVEIKKDDYIFARKVEGNKVLIIKVVDDNMKFLHSVDITGEDNEALQKQHESIVEKFLSRLDELDHEGHSAEIYKEMQRKRGAA